MFDLIVTVRRHRGRLLKGFVIFFSFDFVVVRDFIIMHSTYVYFLLLLFAFFNLIHTMPSFKVCLFFFALCSNLRVKCLISKKMVLRWTNTIYLYRFTCLLSFLSVWYSVAFKLVLSVYVVILSISSQAHSKNLSNCIARMFLANLIQQSLLLSHW